MKKFVFAILCVCAMLSGCYNISLNVPEEAVNAKACQCKAGECKCCDACPCKHKGKVEIKQTPNAQTSIQKKIDETVHELVK